MTRPIIAVRVSEELEQSLIFCAKELNKPKTELVNNALVKYLEDVEDFISAKKILAKNEATISQAEMERELGI
jgi:predicted DNA-binding protein